MTPTSSPATPDTPDKATLWEDEQGLALQTVVITGVLVVIGASVGAFLIARTREAETTSGDAVESALDQISDAMASVAVTTTT